MKFTLAKVVVTTFKNPNVVPKAEVIVFPMERTVDPESSTFFLISSQPSVSRLTNTHEVE